MIFDLTLYFLFVFVPAGILVLATASIVHSERLIRSVRSSRNRSVSGHHVFGETVMHGEFGASPRSRCRSRSFKTHDWKEDGF